VLLDVLLDELDQLVPILQHALIHLSCPLLVQIRYFLRCIRTPIGLVGWLHLLHTTLRVLSARRVLLELQVQVPSHPIHTCLLLGIVVIVDEDGHGSVGGGASVFGSGLFGAHVQGGQVLAVLLARCLELVHLVNRFLVLSLQCLSFRGLMLLGIHIIF